MIFQDEILYQETRRLIAGQMQNIVYGEYLPTVLGVDVMRRYDLIVEEESEYDSGVDATIVNSFASSAFRFGHSMVNGMFKLVSQRKTSRNKDVYWLWRLREVFDGQSIRGARSVGVVVVPAAVVAVVSGFLLLLRCCCCFC